MEKETLINRVNNTHEFITNMDQKNGIKWGIKYIEFINNKITNFEMEQIGDWGDMEELPHTIKTIDISEGGVKTERVYTHSALTTFYDSSTGFYYIIGKSNVIYFLVLQNLQNGTGKNTKRKKCKQSGIFKMKQYLIPKNEYNGLSFSNVSEKTNNYFI